MAEGVDLASLAVRYERGLVPLCQAEPGGRSLRDPDKPGALTESFRDDLALIATKLNPTMSEAQSDAWIKVMTSALEQIPGRVLREAAQIVLRKPLRFFSEADGAIRAEADRIMDRHRTALMRLRAMQAEIARAAEPAPALPPPDGDGPITDAEIRRMPDYVRKMGLNAGWLTEEQIAGAIAEPEITAEAAE